MSGEVIVILWTYINHGLEVMNPVTLDIQNKVMGPVIQDI